MKMTVSFVASLFLVGAAAVAPIGIPQDQPRGAEPAQVIVQDAPKVVPLGPAIPAQKIPQVVVQPQPALQLQPAPQVQVLQEEVRYSPFHAVQIANQDAIAVAALSSPELQIESIRYLSLANIPEAKRLTAKAILDRVLNGLNPGYRRIVRTAGLPAGQPIPVVLRVNLDDYNIRPEAWDYLAENGSGQVPIPDPYFHEFVEKDSLATPDAPKTKPRRVYATASWLAIEQDAEARGSTIANLTKMTGTANPILRGDWFVNYATWGSAYYRLIGLDLKDNPVEADKAKTPKVYLEKDFERLFDFNFKESVEDIVGAVADTKLVTLHNRILHRFSTRKGITGGYFWRSQDTATGIDDHDYMANIETFATPALDVQEIITSGRNGLAFYAITDNKGRLLDLADAKVAHHSAAMPTKLRDQQVWNARNCMLCHAAGLQPINCKVRNLARGQIGLFVTDHFKQQNRTLARQIIEAFEPNLQSIIDHDNAKYNAAALAACGKPGRAVGSDFESMVAEYFDQPVTLERMAWDVGLAPATLKAMLVEGINLDYQLTGVLQMPEEASAILPWERQGHAALMHYVIGYQPKK